MGAVRTVSLSLVVAALVAFAAAPAQAQDAEKARQLFQQGSKYYDLGQFDKAIEAWQQGYDQKPDPGFLYNIAQAYRRKQDAPRRSSYKVPPELAEGAQPRGNSDRDSGPAKRQATPARRPRRRPPTTCRRRPLRRRRPAARRRRPLDADGDARPSRPSRRCNRRRRCSRTRRPTVVEATPPAAFTNTHRIDTMAAIGRATGSRVSTAKRSRRSCSTRRPGTFGGGAARFRSGSAGCSATRSWARTRTSRTSFVSFLVDRGWRSG